MTRPSGPSPGGTPSPMVWVHKFTIAVAFLCVFGYGLWELTRGGPGGGLRGTVAIAASAGIGRYFWSIRTNLATRLSHDGR